MGTSKGYIAPTTSHWSTAKRAVTAFINNRDFDSKAKAASKYATAMKTDMSTGGSFQSAAARTLGFAQKVASGGLRFICTHGNSITHFFYLLRLFHIYHISNC